MINNILSAIEYCQGFVEPAISFVVEQEIKKSGFNKTVDFYSNKINIVEYKKINAQEMWKLLKEKRALLSPEAFIQYKFGLPYINGKNINIKDLEQYEGFVYVIE